MSDRVERAKAKGTLASELALTGASIGAFIGGPVGAGVGALAGATTGLIVGDGDFLITVPMIAIPAHEYSAMLAGHTPTTQLYLHAGEMITQVQPTESQESMQVLQEQAETKPKRKKTTAYNRFVRQYFKDHKKKSPNSRKTNAKVMKEAATAWRRKKK